MSTSPRVYARIHTPLTRTSSFLCLRHFYLRKFQLSSAVNPLKYSNVKGNYAVHSIGTVWANMLHNVHAALLAAHGYSETAFTNPDAHADAGNVVFMRLFIDALAIQPCNPTCTYIDVVKWDLDLPSFSQSLTLAMLGFKQMRIATKEAISA